MSERMINSIIVHCSDGETGDVDSIRKFHMAPPPEGRGWKDIGYHYVILKDGTIQFGRLEETIGAHCEGHNANSIGICLIGSHNFTYEQILAVRYFVRDLLKKYGLKPEQVYMHQELDKKGKTCPNPNDVLRALFKEGK